MKYELGLFLISVSAVLSAQNAVRNGAFDFPWRMNGTRMILSQEEVSRSADPAVWKRTPFEGWWVNGTDKSTVHVENERGAMLFSGANYDLCSTPLPKPAGSMVLSLDIETKYAGGEIILAAVEFSENNQMKVVGLKTAELPENAEDIGRYTLAYPDMPGTHAIIRFRLFKGSVKIDNVQLEPGTEATAFAPRPEEYLELRLGRFTSDSFPRFTAGKSNPQKLVIQNHSGRVLNGKLKIYLDPWNDPGKTLAAVVELDGLKQDRTVSCELEPGKLKPGVYVVLVELLDEKGQTVVSEKIFDPQAPDVKCKFSAHNGLCFGVFPDLPPQKIFGIGNHLTGISEQESYRRTNDFLLAKDLHYNGFMTLRSESSLFNLALAGAEAALATRLETSFGHIEYANPAAVRMLDIYNPEAKKIMTDRARRTGDFLEAGPGFSAVEIQQDSPYPENGALFPTDPADKDFRDWLKEEYGSLTAVNRNWHTEYADWKEIEPVLSANKAKTDEFAGIVALNTKLAEEMNRTPGLAMDWCRWRTESGLDFYRTEAETIREYAPSKLVGGSFTTPAFWPQIVLPFARFTNVQMLNQVYPANRESGSFDAMIDSLEMMESAAEESPVWGTRIYLQPDTAPGIVRLQNWSLLAHGIRHALIYAWRPYSINARSAFAAGTETQNTQGAGPRWMLLDENGKPFPVYDETRKSVMEIEKFHKLFDGTTLKRLEADAVFYIPDDTAEFVMMTTAGEPEKSILTISRTGLGAQIRLAGAVMKYMDDVALLEMNNSDYKTVLVPPSPVMSDEALQKLADFAEDGGTVVLTGPCGFYDPWLNPREEIAGGFFAKGWTLPEAWKDFRKFNELLGQPHTSTVMDLEIPEIPGGHTMMNYSEKKVGSVLNLGSGRIVQLNRWPYHHAASEIQTSPELRDSLESLLENLSAKRLAYWIAEEDTPEVKGYGFPGSGAPCVEVIVRKKSKNEMFMFVLNHGGAGKGRVFLSEYNWDLQDVFSSVPVPTYGHSIPLELPAFGYRILHMTR